MSSCRRLFQRSCSVGNKLFHQHKDLKNNMGHLFAAGHILASGNARREVWAKSSASITTRSSLNHSTVPNVVRSEFNSEKFEGSDYNENSGKQSSKYNHYHTVIYVVDAAAITAAMVIIYYMYFQGNEESEIIFAQELTHVKALDGETAPVYKIVLTGGPCGGKSSALSILRERFQALGFEVYSVSEVATMMFLGGAKFNPSMDLNMLLAFEGALLKTQMSLEDCFIECAKASKKPSIVICDRGALDIKAYLDKNTFEVLLDIHSLTTSKLLNRYDCIIHLVSAAIGAEKFYTLSNNEARTETLEQAIDLDHKLRKAYLGHSNLNVVDNSTGFDGKLQRVVNIVSRMVGLPKPVGIRRKLKLKGPITNQQIPIHFEEAQMEQIILDSQNEQKRIKKVQRSDGGALYSVSAKVLSEDGKEEVVVFRPITSKNYVLLKQVQQSKDHKPMTKIVRSFLYKENYFELITYCTSSLSLTDPNNVTVLCADAEIGKKLSIPNFLENDVEKDVTFDLAFSSYNLSKIKQ